MYINREDSHEEGMDQEPVSDEYDNGEHAKLTDGPVRKERDDAEDGVVEDEICREIKTIKPCARPFQTRLTR